MKVIIHHVDQNAHAILRFGDLDVVGVYDERGKYNGKNVYELIGVENKKLIISNNFDRVLENEADMLITTGEGLYFTKEKNVRDWRENIKKAFDKGVSVYSMSKVFYDLDTVDLKEEAHEKGVRFTEASDRDAYKDYLNFAMQENVNAKVINFSGTGMNSGKITSLMIFKKELESRGLKVGVLGTEPCSEFIGADEQIIPEVLPTNRGAAAIYGAIKKIDVEKKPDIILVGNQTGIKAPVLDVAEVRAGAIVAWQILLGSKPDRVVLCSKWNKTDEIESHLRIFEEYGIHVAALILNGKGCKDIVKVAEDVEQKYGLPCLDVLKMPSKIKGLVEVLI